MGLLDKILGAAFNAMKNAAYQVKPMSEEYNVFEIFNGELYSGYETKTSNYRRYTMDFRNVSQQDVNNYISILNQNGYTKGSEVRYDKDNRYIIVEYKKTMNELHLVFHIKNY